MVAAKSSASKKTKAASTLKSPKTPKADKLSKQVTKPPKQTASKEELLKTGLNAALVKKAVQALIKYHESTNADKLSLLGNDQPIQVQFTLLRTPGKVTAKPIRILIPHSLFQVKSEEKDKKTTSGNIEEPEVCLIVKEEAKPWCQEMIERFPEHMGCVKKVLGLQSLRTKHARYDQRRSLLQKFSVFMADDRILPMLSKSLGTDFYKAKKLPIPISLTRKDALPFAIQKALSATYMTISKGTCIMVRAGNTSMSPEHLSANIVRIAEEAVPKLPLKWANVQNIAIKTPESVALPVYNKTPEVLMEIAAKAGVVQKIDEPEKVKVEKSAIKELKEKEKKREMTSPLLRALKKQKQEEKTKQNKDEPSSAVKITEESTPKTKKRRSLSEDSSGSKKTESAKKTKAEQEIAKVESTPKVSKKAEKKPDSSDKKSKKRKESEQPTESNKDFISAAKYKGSKKGYVFRMGKQGVGYYVDIKPVVDQMAMDALLRAARGKGGNAGPKKTKKKGGRRF